MAINFTEIDIKDIVFSPLQDNVYIPSQRISWTSKADNSKLLVQTPKLITETYGIPRDGVFTQLISQDPYISYRCAMSVSNTQKMLTTVKLTSFMQR